MDQEVEGVEAGEVVAAVPGQLGEGTPQAVPEVVEAVNYNSGIFPLFLGMFLFVFAATGVANGSTYRMIPHIFKAQADAATPEGTVERYAAEAKAVKEGSAALGIIGDLLYAQRVLTQRTLERPTAPPAGLRMVAGNADATRRQPKGTVAWSCGGVGRPNDATNQSATAG